MLDALPLELLQHVARWLDAAGVANAALSCKTAWAALGSAKRPDPRGTSTLALLRQGWHWPAVLQRARLGCSVLDVMARRCVDGGPQRAVYGELLATVTSPEPDGATTLVLSKPGAPGYTLIIGVGPHVYSADGGVRVFVTSTKPGARACECQRPAPHVLYGVVRARAGHGAVVLQAATRAGLTRGAEGGVDIIEAAIRLRQCSHWLAALMPSGVVTGWVPFAGFRPLL